MKFTRVDIDQNEMRITKDLAEHELFLSFVDDVGAEKFCDWWHEVGSEQFGDWMLEQGVHKCWIQD